MKYKNARKTRFSGFHVGLLDPETQAWDQYYCSGAIEDMGYLYLVLHYEKSARSKVLDGVKYVPVHNIIDIVIEARGNGEKYVIDQPNYEFLTGKTQEPTKPN